jgi:2-hydroxycyclohexanecarboxyl-CoA dehydrogenase
VLRANVIGPFLCSQAVLPDMLAGKWGRIVNITSSITQDGAGTMAHYAASKSGLVGLTKAMAMEFAGTGITVNHIPVFFVGTPMLHAAPLNLEAIAATAPAKRWGRAEEVAAACAYLVSDDAGYVTGQPLSLNGGRYLPLTSSPVDSRATFEHSRWISQYCMMRLRSLILSKADVPLPFRQIQRHSAGATCAST